MPGKHRLDRTICKGTRKSQERSHGKRHPSSLLWKPALVTNGDSLVRRIWEEPAEEDWNCIWRLEFITGNKNTI